MKLWIALYRHRHGIDAMSYFQDQEPEQSQVIQDIDEAGGEYEGEGSKAAEEDQRDDEWIEVYGSWDIPPPPDLLAACKAMLDELDPNGDEPTRGTTLARAAIAVAEGCTQ